MRSFDSAVLAGSTSIKWELSPPDVGTGRINKKNQVVSLPLPVLLLMVDEREENVVAENTGESAVELSFAGRNAYEQLQTNNNSVSMVYERP